MKEIGAGVLGAGVGGVQGYVLRKYADTTQLVPQLGSWGFPSALVDIVTGLVGLGLGGSGLMKKGPLSRNKPVAMGLTGYGIVTLVGGVYSGMKPVAGAARMQRVPMRQIPTAPAVQVPAPQMQPIRTVERGGGIVIRSLSM